VGALALVLGLLCAGDTMARTLTAAQQDALELRDRSTFVKVYVEDPDSVMVDYTDFDGRGIDFLDRVHISANADHPISSAQITLWREIDPDGFEKLSIAPLIEASVLNRDSGGSYAAATNPARQVEVWTAMLPQGEQPASGDYDLLWDGYVDDVEWGGRSSKLTLFCRDPLSRLNDTIIETVTTYGGGSPLPAIEDVMQQILDEHMGSGAFPLWVEGDPDFGLEEYELGHVSVLAALNTLVDLIGWNLHWRWQESPGEFRLTLYQPVRDRAILSGYTPDWTFGPNDYYDLPGVRLPLSGVRNAGEVIYLDVNGDKQTVTEERSGSTAEFYRRFLRLDERGGRHIQTAAQASALLSSILDDLSVPPLLQNVDAPFHWPIELGDVFDFASNDVHYDTTKSLAVFGYTHILEAGQDGRGRIRTLIDTSGQPSGGYRRWLARERASRSSGKPRGDPPYGRLRPGPNVSVSVDADGRAIVSASDVDAERIFVAVGDGTAPAYPTPDDNDGEISGVSGTVSTTVKITTGNEAHVRVVARDADGLYSQETVARHPRRIGPFYKDTSGTTVTGTTDETTLDTITIPAGILGLDGGVRLTAALLVTGTNGSKTIRLKFGSTTLETMTIAAGFAAAARLDVLLFNDAAADSQVVSTLLHRHSGNPDVRLTTSSEDTSGARNLVITVQLANASDSVSLQAGYGELVGTN